VSQVDFAEVVRWDGEMEDDAQGPQFANGGTPSLIPEVYSSIRAGIVLDGVRKGQSRL
jgi:hypothetical protein